MCIRAEWQFHQSYDMVSSALKSISREYKHQTPERPGAQDHSSLKRQIKPNTPTSGFGNPRTNRNVKNIRKNFGVTQGTLDFPAMSWKVSTTLSITFTTVYDQVDDYFHQKNFQNFRTICNKFVPSANIFISIQVNRFIGRF